MWVCDTTQLVFGKRTVPAIIDVSVAVTVALVVVVVVVVLVVVVVVVVVIVGQCYYSRCCR